MSMLSTSVLIASTRPAALSRCLQGLARQTCPPDEILIAWQGEDASVRDAAVHAAADLGLRIRPIHSAERGVVPAENAALDAATGEIILLIDDDAVATPDWLARHLAHYADPTVGAVGGPFMNFNPDGSPFSKQSREPIGEISWYGKAIGNIYDHDDAWRARPPAQVRHLAGGNMSLRRAAFDRFEGRLRRYWQFFEMDACLQVQARGFRVLFDFANVIDHHPTSDTFRADRVGDLAVKIFNPAYNQAFVLAKHLTGFRRWAALAYLIGAGSVGTPGVASFPIATWRYGHPLREWSILCKTLQSRRQGWRAGSEARTRPLAVQPAHAAAAMTRPA